MTSVIAEDIAQHPQNGKSDWGGLLFLIAVVVLLVWGLVRILGWMSDEQQLPLSKMVIHGELSHVTADEVRQAVNAGGALNSFMLQDVDAIHDVVSAIPWVDRVTVRKQWPDIIKLHITEHGVAAIWNSSQLLDVDGTQFAADPSDVKDRNLVSLHGPQDKGPEVLAAWREMNNILAPEGIDIAALALNERQSWRIVTRDGVRIELGRRDREERLRRLVTLLTDIRQSGHMLSYVDLRYDTGAAVGWKDNRDRLNQK
ncbi:cell division protein FtsQ/DivIB [Veronia pacifica]|uniref:Cell division protein FtsQ n=1 Tax=Veronia pacifica TaxID=1080227 RepID=A0A1C3ELH7_9GAMM|nr:cell division protein FtsQ/DivIB [Veronia pacifica]ODA34086.1 cell division protein FtsQ [Veronia pacifica]